MTAKSIIASLGLIVWHGMIAQAAPPDVTSLFPAGCQQGSSANVTIQGKLGDGVNRVWYSRPGVTVSFPEKPGPIKIDVAAWAEPGVCWLRFYNDEGASGLRPFVIGTHPETDEAEPNDDVAKAPPLPDLPVLVNGRHGKNGDADCFAVSLKKGQIIVASLMANRTLGSPQDAVLQILGPEGFVLEQNEDDQGFDPQLTFAAPADGIYTLRTWAFPATPDSSIRLFGSPACVYRLLVTGSSFVDHVLPLAIQGGQTQQLQLRGWNLTRNEIDVTAPVSAIGRRFEWPVDGLSHRLPVSIIVSPDAAIVEREPNDLAQALPMAVPGVASGEISQPRDIDTYQFQAKKGQRLRFEVSAREWGSPLDPVIRIYDAAGKLLREADDDGRQSIDPDVEYTLPADGVFRVTVSDRFSHGGERYAYLLSITETQPDFTLSVAADAFVLNAGKPLEIPVTIIRSGFEQEIAVRATGMPDGVSAEPVMSAPKGDSSKTVKLILKSDGHTTFSGPIQIVGRPAEFSSEKVATVTLKAFQTESSSIWLTVKK
ncbi:MAG TPA: PPC domain-containing protein [Schlesneria sp.]